MKTNNLAGACVLVADEAYSIIAVEKFWWTLLPAVHQCWVIGDVFRWLYVFVCMYDCLARLRRSAWVQIFSHTGYKLQKILLHFGGNCVGQWWGRNEKLNIFCSQGFVLVLFECCGIPDNVIIDSWLWHRSIMFLGRLPKVDLIILKGEKCPSVRPSVRPQEVSSISMKFGIQVQVDEWCTTVCRMAGSKVKVKVMSPSKFEFLPFSKPISCVIYNGSWQVTTNS